MKTIDVRCSKCGAEAGDPCTRTSKSAGAMQPLAHGKWGWVGQAIKGYHDARRQHARTVKVLTPLIDRMFKNTP